MNRHGAIVAVCVLAGVASGQCDGPLFDAWQPFPEYFGELNAIATGDLDGDGDIDAIINRYTSYGTVVLINDGSGFFTETQSISTLYTFKLVLADVEGDSDLDAILYGYSSIPTRFLINDGTGALTLSSVELPFGVEAAHGDIDGDGDIDFVNPSGVYLIYEQVTLLDFQERSYRPGLPSATASELWDVDGDSDLDLTYIGSGDDEFIVSLNDGTGAFGEATVHTSTSTFNTQLFGDIDNDGDLDVLLHYRAASGEMNLPGFRNDGAGVFSPVSTIAPAYRLPTVVLHDADADGRLDLFDGHYTWRGGDGSWTFDYPGPLWGWEWFYPSYTTWAELADLDGDGDEEFIVCAPSGSLWTGYTIDGSYLAGPGDEARFLPSGVYQGGLGDIDADGDLDVIAAGSNTITTLENTGTGFFGNMLESTPSIIPRYNFSIADFNLDGVSDVATVSGEVSVYLGDGMGGFGGPLVSDSFGLFVRPDDGAGVGLINDDPYPDVFAASFRDNLVAVWLGDGTGGFGANIQSPLPATDVIGTALGDFDGDGNTDAAVLELHGRLVVLQGHGDGTFSFVNERVLASSCGGGFFENDLDAADIDDDGDLDLTVPVGCGLGSAEVAILRNEGGWVFAAEEVSAGTTSSYWRSQAGSPLYVDADDVTGDGRTDLVLSRSRPDAFSPSEAGGVFSVIPGEEGGGYGTPRVYRMGGGRFDLAGFVDFDGDGDKDAVQIGLIRNRPGENGFAPGVAVAFNRCTSPGCAADLTSVNAPVGDPNYGVPDGAVTAADIQFYVNAWVAGDGAIADLTTQNAPVGDPSYGVPDGLVSAIDIQFYVNLWIQGCP